MKLQVMVGEQDVSAFLQPPMFAPLTNGMPTRAWTWDTPISAAPLTHLDEVRLLGRQLPMDRVVMSQRTYRTLCDAWRAAWWRALPRRDKAWLRRQGVAR